MAEGKRAVDYPSHRAKPLPSAPPARSWFDTFPPESSEPFQSQPPSGVFRRPRRAAGVDPLAVLVRDVLSGNRNSETELLRRLTPALRRFLCYAIPKRQDRDDVLQVALLTLTTALPRFRGDSTVLHFAVQLTRHVSAAWRRALKRELSGEARVAELELPLVEEPDCPHTSALKLRRRERLLSLLDALPAEQANAFLLRIVYGHSISEVSALTGVPTGTVRSRVRAAQQTLRRNLETK